MNDITTTVKRQLRLDILKDDENTCKAVETLAGLPGVLEADIDPAKTQLRVSYDVTRLQFPALVRALKSVKLLRNPGWWDRFRFSWYGYMDINNRDNITAKSSPCCSNPEEITRPSRKKGCH